MRRSTERPAIAAVAALLLLAGCAAQGEVHAKVQAVNHTGAAATLILKAWDHTGAQVFNATVQVQPGQTVEAGTVAGPPATYGSAYSWFAYAGGALQRQEERGPGGLTAWTIHLYDGRVDFAFS